MGGQPGCCCPRTNPTTVPASTRWRVESGHGATATEVQCECGHETTVFPAFVRPWLEEIPGRIEGDESLAIADDDGLFTCTGCARRVYVPTASMN